MLGGLVSKKQGDPIGRGGSARYELWERYPSRRIIEEPSEIFRLPAGQRAFRVVPESIDLRAWSWQIEPRHTSAFASA